MEINKEIEHHTQQRYLITYVSKDKEKLQTPAVTPKRIQPPTWKKTRVESPTNLSYHYTSGKVTESEEEKEEETEDQKFTYQNPIAKNPEFETLNLQTQQNLNPENPEIKTPNIQTPPTQDNQNPDLINQQNLPPIIVIDQPPINPIAKPIQLPLQLPSQQPNLDTMAYAPIAKLDNFTSKENNAQIWLNDIEKAIVVNG
ncbi:hypothetical protein G9A89_006956 [Geosiphon pyriformis]|nr:hypothetical protein G9A89_006956 [Geosiphon pyriformis]